MSEYLKKANEFFGKVVDNGANIHFGAEKAGIRTYWLSHGIELGLYIATAVFSPKYRLLAIIGLMGRIPTALVSSKLDAEELNKIKSFLKSVAPPVQDGNKTIPPTKIN